MFSTIPPLSHTPHHAELLKLQQPPQTMNNRSLAGNCLSKAYSSTRLVIPNLCLASCCLPNHVSSLFLGLLGLQLPVLLFPCLLSELQHSVDWAEWQAEQRRSG